MPLVEAKNTQSKKERGKEKKSNNTQRNSKRTYHGLSGAGRAVEQHASGRVDADLLVQLELRQRKLNRLPHLFICRYKGDNITKGETRILMCKVKYASHSVRRRKDILAHQKHEIQKKHTSCFCTSQPPISWYVTSGFSTINWMELSDSGGRMSTTAWECLCRAMEVFGFSFSLSRVLRTRT